MSTLKYYTVLCMLETEFELDDETVCNVLKQYVKKKKNIYKSERLKLGRI